MFAIAPRLAGLLALGLLAGVFLAGPSRADPQAKGKEGSASATSANAPATDAWQDLVDGLQVRRTLAPPDASDASAAKTLKAAKAGDFCEVQFHAFELAPDGVTRAKLLDAAAFGESPRQVVIGEGREKSALEWGLIGLLPGEGRQVRAPARHWPGAAGPVLIEAQLLERRDGISMERLNASAPASAVRAGKGDGVAFHFALSVLDAKGDPGTPVLPPADGACTVGDGTLVRGLDLGLRGMAAGESRAITIPAYLGYGDAGAGGDLIPPGSTLWVVVEMRKVEKRK